MRFKQIVFENYKTYYGHQKIDLSITDEDKKANRNIILLGGLNGAGKTTILKAIRYILFGQRGISKVEYERLLANTINNTYYDEGGRECSISLTLQMESGEEWRLKIKWLFDKQKILVTEDREIHVKKPGSRNERKMNVTDVATFNQFIDRIIPYNAAPFFIFDGEEIKDLITKQNSTEMKEAIHKITGLDSYKLMMKDLTLLESKLYKQLSSATNKSTLDKYKVELDELEEKINRYEKFLTKSRKEIQSIEQEIQHTTKQRNDKLSNNSKSRETLVRKQSQIHTKLAMLKEDLEEQYKNNVLYIILNKDLRSLKQNIKSEKEIRNKKIMRENSLETYNKFINKLFGRDIRSPFNGRSIKSDQNDW